MKKKALKIIKNFAALLPKTVEEYNVIEHTRGAEFIKRGITQVDGVDIIPDKIYTSTTIKLRVIDHCRRLKRLFENGDNNAVETYKKWLNNHNDVMAAKYPKLFEKASNN